MKHRYRLTLGRETMKASVTLHANHTLQDIATYQAFGSCKPVKP